ncbi:MAG TPA: crossover junction endodeoxyribonuclease RuvC [Acidimicrobiia bacterium]
MFDDVAGRVLGIDPGLSRCGYGAITASRGDLRATAYGVIRTPAEAPVPERLAMLQRELEALIDDVRPELVAVERVLFQTNVRTAMSVGQASGIALATAALRSVPVAELSPNEVKLAVSGYGAADKAQVQAMVTRLLGLASVPSPPDAADALALAICATTGRARRTAADGHPVSDRYAAAVAAAVAKEER